jgi:hypothetical protein
VNENSGLEPGFTPDRALTQAGANLSRRMEWIVLKMHKFTLGQTVRYIAGPLNRATADGTFKIMKLLPPEGDEHQYRIKNTEEAFERVAKESQLDRYR